MSLRRLATIAVLGFTVASCSSEEIGPPVANVSFSTSKPQLTIGSPVDLTYKFEVLPNAPPIDGDYTVFVHVSDTDGDMLWADDHEPPVKTSLWKPGQTIGPYTRTRFVPRFPYSGQATVTVGLYKPGTDNRIVLSSAIADEKLAPKREYKVAQTEILPATDTVKLGAGWHGEDGDPRNPANQWRWTQKAAQFTIRNPRTDVTLILESDARTDVFTPPQVVTITANGAQVATFAATNTRAEIRRFPITAAQLGAAESVEFRLEVDRTFNPSQLPAPTRDNRDLGLRVYNLIVESR